MAWVEHFSTQAVEPVDRMVNICCRGEAATPGPVLDHACCSNCSNFVDELADLGIAWMGHHR